MKYDGQKRNDIKNLLVNHDYAGCKKELDLYLKHYPNDIIALYYRVKILLNNGSISKAKRLLQELMKNIHCIKNIRQKNAIIIEYLYILIEEKNYTTALKYYNQIHFEEVSDDYKYRLNGIAILLYKETHDNSIISKADGYYLKQLIEYDRCEAIYHIIKRHIDNVDADSLNISCEELIKLFLELEDNLLDNATKAPYYENVDHYIINYPNITVDENGNSIDRIDVVTNKHTHEIITIYPSKINIREEFVNNFHFDKELKRELKKSNKTSQIEKFNKKYNLE